MPPEERSSISDPLQQNFSGLLPSDLQSAIADKIWGVAQDESVREHLLGFYFRYYIEETTSPGGNRSRGHRRNGVEVVPVKPI